MDSGQLIMAVIMMVMIKMIAMMVKIKRLETKSQSFVIIWENNLLKVAVQSFLSSLSLNSGKINVPELICNHEAFS